MHRINNKENSKIYSIHHLYNLPVLLPSLKNPPDFKNHCLPSSFKSQVIELFPNEKKFIFFYSIRLYIYRGNICVQAVRNVSNTCCFEIDAHSVGDIFLSTNMYFESSRSSHLYSGIRINNFLPFLCAIVQYIAHFGTWNSLEFTGWGLEWLLRKGLLSPCFWTF